MAAVQAGGGADKSEEMIEWEREPLNLETPLGLLGRERLTPNKLFYVRSHGPDPELDPDHYRLTIDGLVERELSFSVADLRERFEQISVEATLNCAGNRRDQLAAVADVPGELIWGNGAIGNASWGGVRLGDLLGAAGVDLRSPDLHAAFEGADRSDEGGGEINYGGSVPIDKAASPETILAWSMNGEPLSGPHGAPLRVVVPGFIGARSVKWLTRITVQAEPSTNHFQASSYRLLPPGMGVGQIDWDLGIPLGEISTNSAICRPAEGESVAAGTVGVSGWALVGGSRRVERVDLSTDGGRSWIQAEIDPDPGPWSWSLWSAALELEPGPVEIVARAWDSAANTQPEDPAALWNVKGYANNAWHRVRIEVSGSVDRR